MENSVEARDKDMALFLDLVSVLEKESLNLTPPSCGPNQGITKGSKQDQKARVGLKDM